MPPSVYTVRPLAAADAPAWRALYHGYAQFYRQPMNDAILTQGWQWLTSGKLHGAVAQVKDAGGELVGFAHWEFILRPLRGAPLAYLHDLFVVPQARGCGAGGKLLAHAAAAAAQNGCQHMRWLTKANNTAARRLYNKTAHAATEWVMYQQALEPRGQA